MLHALLAILPQAPVAAPPTATVLHMATTGVAVRLELPEFVPDPAVLTSLKRRFGDRGLMQGKLRGDSTILVVSAYGELRSSQEWRASLMAGRLAGLGQFDVGATACTEASKELEAPYSNLSWHAFLTMADTCFDVTIGSLAKDGVAPFMRADLDALVKSARFAIVRLGQWEDMPAAVLEHMQAGLARPERDAATFLAERAKSADGGWACALAAAEIGMRMQMSAADRLALYDRVLADLAKLEARPADVLFAEMTALSGRASCLRDEKKYDEALAELAKAGDLPGAKSTIAVAALEYDRATIHGLKLDAAAAVEHLGKSIAADPDRRATANRDRSFEGIKASEALRKLIVPPKAK